MKQWLVLVCLYALPLGLAAQTPAQPQTPAPQTPAPQTPSEDPGRPVLRRGGPAQKREEVPAIPVEQRLPPQVGTEITVDEQGRTEKVVQPPNAPPPKPEQTLIGRARAAAYEFDSGLPNFICDEYVMRWFSKTLKPDWKLKDRVQVELTYVGGHEDYRNIRINNKPIKKGTPEDSGTWSSGEFGTILANLFASNTNAQFTPRGESTAVGIRAKVYDYSVSQPTSRWTVRFGRPVQPAYRGSIWIDPESARVLRIEMRTRQLPSDYEIDTVETTVDYGWVTISGQRVLLPVKSENLACVRGSFDCVRNEIDFRNYRKFQVESQILQVESDIVYPESEDGKKPESKTTPPSITPEPPKPEPAKKKN